MNAEIWFFFTPDGTAEITVLNRESAKHVAQLMSSEQRNLWKVRKNRWPEAMIVADCEDLMDFSSDIGEAQSLQSEFDREAKTELHNVKAKAKQAPLQAKHQPVAHVQKPHKEHTHAHIESPRIEAPKFEVPDFEIQGDAGGLRLESDHILMNAPTVELDAEEARELAAPKATKHTASHQVAHKKSTQHTHVGHSPAAQQSKEARDQRKHPRYPVKLRVVVISGNKSFRSFSRNVSRGGLMLEHVIPIDLLGKPCRVIIGSVDLKENIEFDARLTGDPDNPRCIAFNEGKEFFIKKLDSWLEALGGSTRAAS